ncbi:MAG: zf-TFIIB domain-containing protein [Alphaproteobacteria bacterium]
MKCPNDSTDLVMSERQGIEIDYCPKCRGVWLDRGELDKIIERNAASEAAAPSPRQPQYRGDDDDRHHEKHPRRHKRKSLLGELFDF